MHYVIRADLNEARFAVRATVLNQEGFRFKPTLGVPFGKSLPHLTARLDQRLDPADCIESGPFLIVSEKVRSIFESLGCAAQYHSLDLCHKDMSGRIAGKFFIANILEAIDCLDHARADFEMDGDYVDKIDKLVIDEEKIKAVPLLRVNNTYDNIILASDELIHLCRNACVSGMEFISPENWTW